MKYFILLWNLLGIRHTPLGVSVVQPTSEWFCNISAASAGQWVRHGFLLVFYRT